MAPSSATSPAAKPSGAQLSTTKTTVEFRAALVAMAVVALIPLGVSNPYWLGVLVVSMTYGRACFYAHGGGSHLREPEARNCR